MNNTTSISVIIPSFNGASHIQYAIEAILNQSVPPNEIIVVIDGSTDNTRDVLLPFIENNGVKAIYQDNVGRSATRNVGAKRSVGQLLVFYDDDTRPEPDSLERHQAFHQIHKRALCGGFPLEDERKLETDFLKYRRYLSLKWTKKYRNDLNELNSKNLFLTAANLSIKRTDFVLLGGFNTQLADAEDYELGLRAIESGFSIYFDKLNIAWHDDFVTCKKYLIRQIEYKKSHQKLLTISVTKNSRNIKMSAYKKTFFRCFANETFLSWIDNQKLLWIPRVFRYKLYDLVITGGSLFYRK